MLNVYKSFIENEKENSIFSLRKILKILINKNVYLYIIGYVDTCALDICFFM